MKLYKNKSGDILLGYVNINRHVCVRLKDCLYSNVWSENIECLDTVKVKTVDKIYMGEDFIIVVDSMIFFHKEHSRDVYYLSFRYKSDPFGRNKLVIVDRWQSTSFDVLSSHIKYKTIKKEILEFKNK